MTIRYTPKTGTVFVRSFDQGIMDRLGAVAAIRTHPILGQRNGYWLDLPAATPTSVPVMFNEPEPIYERRVYPSVLVAREDPTVNMARWHSVGQLEYIDGVSGTFGAVVLNPFTGARVSGYAEVESKIQAMPFDLNYTITIFARWEHEAIPMLFRVLQRFQPFSRIPVVDSLGNTRTYTTFSDGGWSNQSELVDVADRVKAYSLSVKVEAELDLNDPIVRSTVATIVTNFGLL